jgi:hypothetical protein
MRRALLIFVGLVSVPSAGWAQAGMPLGPEFRVNTYTTLDQGYSAVTADASGNFVVVWRSEGQDGSFDGIFAQRYSTSGSPLGPEFRVNLNTVGFQVEPAVAAEPSGSFVIAWTDLDCCFDVLAQRYESTGAPLGPQFRVNTSTPTVQSGPAVVADSSGNFVVVWESNYQDGSYRGVFAQRFAASGVPSGPEFRVNTYTTSLQLYPWVSADPAGNFVVVWSSNLQDGSGLGVFGQRYGPIVPVELMEFGIE